MLLASRAPDVLNLGLDVYFMPSPPPFFSLLQSGLYTDLIPAQKIRQKARTAARRLIKINSEVRVSGLTRGGGSSAHV